MFILSLFCPNFAHRVGKIVRLSIEKVCPLLLGLSVRKNQYSDQNPESSIIIIIPSTTLHVHKTNKQRII